MSLRRGCETFSTDLFKTAETRIISGRRKVVRSRGAGIRFLVMEGRGRLFMETRDWVPTEHEGFGGIGHKSVEVVSMATNVLPLVVGIR